MHVYCNVIWGFYRATLLVRWLRVRCRMAFYCKRIYEIRILQESSCAKVLLVNKVCSSLDVGGGMKASQGRRRHWNWSESDDVHAPAHTREDQVTLCPWSLQMRGFYFGSSQHNDPSCRLEPGVSPLCCSVYNRGVSCQDHDSTSSPRQSVMKPTFSSPPIPKRGGSAPSPTTSLTPGPASCAHTHTHRAVSPNPRLMPVHPWLFF